MSNCGGKNTSSLKELYMINAQTYNALLNKLTSLERAEIDRLNTQTNHTGNENLSMPTNSLSEVSNNEGNFQNNDQDRCSSSTTEKNISVRPRIQSSLEKREAEDQIELDSDNVSNQTTEEAEHEPVLGPTKVPIDLESNSRKRKRPHKMPHIVKLSTGPGILRKTIRDGEQDENVLGEINDETKSDSEVIDKQGKENEQNSNQTDDNVGKNLGSHQCPICFKWYKNRFTKFRHLTTVHSSSDEAQQALSQKKAIEAKNRNKMRLKTKAIKHLNHKVKVFGSSSSKMKRGLKRARTQNDDDESEIEDRNKKQQLEILNPNNNSTKEKKNKKKKSLSKNASPAKPLIKAKALDSDDEVMEEEKTRRASIAGVKRSKTRQVDSGLIKIGRGTAPKRKAKTAAMIALKGKKARKSNVNSSKVPKKSQDFHGFSTDDGEEEYGEW